jgi:TatD DNase family protein
VGEFGLDKVAVPLDARGVRIPGAEPDYENQLRCFREQLDVASELRRPAVLHCVKAFGDLGDILRNRETFPSKVLMHSYGGTKAFLEGLVKMKRFGSRFYFGFSSVVNSRSPKTRDVVRAVPDDRLLVESDAEDADGAEESLRSILAFAAEAKGWTVEETARVTRANAERFYGDA